ncbi:MAG: HypC/HybG/HupF family hydrogenase formation chaperone [Elusimicrobiales bacterium]|nr:HypC/HybG/HupF family hydrogenase formation chaperone [Elusimicrobiales bacterium]
MCLSIPAKVIKIEGNNVVVDFGGSQKTVSKVLFPDISVGDYVLVHAGFIIQKLDRDEALKTLDTFKRIYDSNK